MAKFLVDGQERTLRMVTPEGVDWSDDYIGGFDHGMTRDDDGRWICSETDYEWWVKATNDQTAADALIAEARTRHSYDAIDEVLAYINTDPNEYLESVKRGLAELDG